MDSVAAPLGSGSRGAVVASRKWMASQRDAGAVLDGGRRAVNAKGAAAAK
jgi:hypothetical protein